MTGRKQKAKKIILVLTPPIIESLKKTRAEREKYIGVETGYFTDEELLLIGLEKVRQWYPVLAQKQKRRSSKCENQCTLFDEEDLELSDPLPCQECESFQKCPCHDPHAGCETEVPA